MGLCRALESKIWVSLAPFPSLGSLKAAELRPQHPFVVRRMWVRFPASARAALTVVPTLGGGRRHLQKVKQMLGEVFALRRCLLMVAEPLNWV